MEKTNICPKCGAELQENAQFCLHCMTSLDTKLIIPKGKGPKPKRFRMVVAIIIAAALLAAAIGTGILMNTKNKTAPICTAEDFISRVSSVSSKLEADSLWSADSFKDIRHSTIDKTVEYSTDLNIGDSLISVFFHNDGEVVSAVVWDIKKDNIDEAKRLLICITDSICGYYFTDIEDVFTDERHYPHTDLGKPFEEYFTDMVKRTGDYKSFISNGNSISTDYIGMDADDLYIVLYTTERLNGENALYDLTVYIERK